MTFLPQAAQTVFHHVADDPIRREKLCGRADTVFGDLYILFEQFEGLVLRWVL